MNAVSITLLAFLLMIVPTVSAANNRSGTDSAGILFEAVGNFSSHQRLENTVNLIPLFRRDTGQLAFRLPEWLDSRTAVTIIAILNRSTPKPFAQLIPFERIARDFSGEGVRFAVIFLHPKPYEFTKYMTSVRSFECPVFATSLSYTDDLGMSLNEPLILYYNSRNSLIAIARQYCDYSCLLDGLTATLKSHHTLTKGDR